jgi:hypothetical protein
MTKKAISHRKTVHGVTLPKGANMVGGQDMA